MSNLRGCTYIFIIWLSGALTCLGTQEVHKLYSEARACEKVDCTSIVQMSESQALAPMLKKVK